MHSDWKGPYQRRLKAQASERGKRMAKCRWGIDRQRRDALAAKDPIRVSGRILRRVIAIYDERIVKEAVIYDFDSIREARRKLRNVMTYGAA